MTSWATWQAIPQWLRPDNISTAKDDSLPTDATVDVVLSGGDMAEQNGDSTDGDIRDVKISLSEEEELEKTPKADATKTTTAVPSFNLDDSHTQSDDDDEDSAPSVFPALNSAQRASSKSGSTLMAPPTPKVSTLMPPPSRQPARQNPTASLRVPSNGPLPNRGPPASAAAIARSSLAPRIDTPNSRKKVLLSPGHSPLDWAALSRSSNLSGVPTFTRVTPSMLKSMNGRKGKPAWSVWQGKVYNISPYLPFHPGGEGELLRGAGKDGTKMFMEAHPWVNWDNMLSTCLVGVLVGEGEGDEGLEGLD